jgi:hypothetical protein
MKPDPTPLLVDSITEAIGPGAGRCVVSGSHGGISAGRFAVQAGVRLAVFNDAGVGRDRAGIAALDLLQSHGIAGCTVSHDSARIGEASSTFEDGVISHANTAALAMGAAPGRRLRDWLSAPPASSGSEFPDRAG